MKREPQQEAQNKDLILASVALLSLTYVSESTLENADSAIVFFQKWIKNSKLLHMINEDDIPRLIDYAKKGERWLENFLNLNSAL